MTAIYLAGGEVSTLADLLEKCEVKHILVSYFWISKKGQARKWVERVERGRAAGRRYILDSGAFTYKVAQSQSEVVPFETYKAQYFKFVKNYGQLFEACAELDIERVKIEGFNNNEPIPFEMVQGWRNEMVELNKNANIMPVWHGATRSKGEWYMVCSDPRFPYLGIGSHSMGAGDTVPVFMKLINHAHRMGKRVHGYAQTKIKTAIKYLKWDSVDSSSWLAAQRFGTTYIFKNGQWIVLDKDHKGERKRYRRHLKSKGVDVEALENDESAALRHAAVIAWRDLGIWLMNKRKKLHQDLQQATLDAQIDGDELVKVEPAKTDEKEDAGPFKTEWQTTDTITIPGPKPGQTNDRQLLERVRHLLAIQRGESDPKQASREETQQSRSPVQQGQEQQEQEWLAESQNGIQRRETREKDRERRETDKGGNEGAPVHPANSQNLTVSPQETPAYLEKLANNSKILKSLPNLRCGVCSIGEDCPAYDENRTDCAFEKSFSAFPVRDADNLLGAMEAIVDLNKGRLWRAYMVENIVEGGLPGDKATHLSQIVLSQLEKLRLQRQEMEGAAVKVSSGKGVLSRLFGTETPGVALQVNVNQNPLHVSSADTGMKREPKTVDTAFAPPESSKSVDLPQGAKHFSENGGYERGAEKGGAFEGVLSHDRGPGCRPSTRGEIQNGPSHVSNFHKGEIDHDSSGTTQVVAAEMPKEDSSIDFIPESGMNRKADFIDDVLKRDSEEKIVAPEAQMRNQDDEAKGGGYEKGGGISERHEMEDGEREGTDQTQGRRTE